MRHTLGMALGLLAPLSAFSLDGIKVLERTDSGRTVILNVGHLDGILRGEYGTLVNQETRARVATGRVVKIYNNTSIWYLSTLPDEGAIGPDSRFFLLHKSEELRGRVTPPVHSRKLVSQEGDAHPIQTLNRNDRRGYPPLVVKEGHLHRELETPRAETGEHPASRIDRRGYGRWTEIDGASYRDENGKDLETLYVQELQGAPKTGALQEKVLLETFETNAQHFVSQTDVDADPNDLYPAAARDSSASDLPDRMRPSRLEELRSTLRDQKIRNEKNIADLEKKRGAGWSDDMSDEELSDYVVANGILSEQFRQRSALKSRAFVQGYASLGFPLRSNDSESADRDRRAVKYDLNGGIEYFLGDSIRPLERFGVDVSLRQSLDSFSTQQTAIGAIQNVTSIEQSIQAAALYYPLGHPSSIGSNVYFLGVGVRRGRATVQGGGMENSYSVAVFPAIMGGLRYHGYSGIGFRLSAAIEPTGYTSATTGDVNFPDTIGFYNYKMDIGLSYIF